MRIFDGPSPSNIVCAACCVPGTPGTLGFICRPCADELHRQTNHGILADFNLYPVASTAGKAPDGGCVRARQGRFGAGAEVSTKQNGMAPGQVGRSAWLLSRVAAVALTLGSQILAPTGSKACAMLRHGLMPVGRRRRSPSMPAANDKPWCLCVQAEGPRCLVPKARRVPLGVVCYFHRDEIDVCFACSRDGTDTTCVLGVGRPVRTWEPGRGARHSTSSTASR